jgi:hypothetical protein
MVMGQAGTQGDAFTASMRDGVLWVHWLHGTSVTDADAAALVQRAHAMSADTCPLMLVELNDMVTLSRAALQRFANTLNVGAMAIVGPSAVDKLLADHFGEVHNPPYPSRYFTTSAQAVQWLNDHPDAP